MEGQRGQALLIREVGTEPGREDEAAEPAAEPGSSEGGSPPAPCAAPLRRGPPQGPGLRAGEEPLTGYKLLLARGLPGRPLRPSPGRRWTQAVPG